MNRLRSLLFSFVLVLLLTDCSEQNAESPPDPGTNIQAIKALLDQQVNDWNAGRIEHFMSGYWQSDSLRFVSGGSVRQGWSETLERYRLTYPDKEAMGTLAFEDLDVRLLTPDIALVHGRFRLRRTETYGDATGLFTLIVQKQAQGWRIIYDHTSSE